MQPYLIKTVEIKVWNPNYDQDEECAVFGCNHAYYRHFDTYEEMYPTGCEYCSCCEFLKAPIPPSELGM